MRIIGSNVSRRTGLQTCTAIACAISTVMLYYLRRDARTNQMQLYQANSRSDKHGFDLLNDMELAANLSAPLRIASFIRLWTSHDFGGMAQVARDRWATGISMHGWEVHVWTTRNVDFQTTYEVDGGIHVHYVQDSSPKAYTESFFVNAVLQFSIENARQPFDLIHMDSRAVPSVRLRPFNLPIGITWHGTSYDLWRTSLQLAALNNKAPEEAETVMYRPDYATTRSQIGHVGLEVWAGAHALKWQFGWHVCISGQATLDHRNIYGAPNRRVFTILNGINAVSFSVSPSARQRFRDRHNVSMKAFLVGYVGRITLDKGAATFAEAIPIVERIAKSAAGRDIVFILAGAGDHSSLFAEMGSSVIFLGPMDHKDLPDLYAAVDIFVDPAIHYHGLNTVVLEAICAAIPVIASDAPRMTQTFGTGHWLRYFPLGQPEGLAEAILDMEKVDGSALKKWGEATRDRWCPEVTLERSVAQYHQLFSYAKVNTKWAIPSLPSSAS